MTHEPQLPAVVAHDLDTPGAPLVPWEPSHDETISTLLDDIDHAVTEALAALPEPPAETTNATPHTGDTTPPTTGRRAAGANGGGTGTAWHGVVR